MRPDHDAHVMAWLLDWLRTATLPTEPFLVNRATLVSEPAAHRTYLLTEAERQPRGQVRTALLAQLRTLRKLAANGWKLEGPTDGP